MTIYCYLKKGITNFKGYEKITFYNIIAIQGNAKSGYWIYNRNYDKEYIPNIYRVKVKQV